MVPARFRPHVALLLVGIHAILVATDVLPRYDALLFAPLTFLFARWTATLGPRLRTLAHVAFFAMVGAGVYAHQLSTGVEGRHALVGGVIPWSDAEGFLSNAWRAIHGLPFSTAVTRTATRPLYPMTFALSIAVWGGNVKLAIATYACVASLFMGHVSSRLALRFGVRAAAVVLLVLAFYLRRYLFVIGTESLGVLAGLAAFSLFLAAIDRHDASRATLVLLASAFFVFGLGTMARPGPLFMLPIVIGWMAWRAPRGKRAIVLTLSAAAVALAVWTNARIIAATAEQSGAVGGEFPPILYGAMHGEDYTYLGQRHPEVANLHQADRMRATASLLVSEVRARPWLALGFLQGGAAFVVSPHGLMSLAFYDPDDAYFEGKAPFGEKLARFAREAGIYRIANLVAMAVLAIAFVVSVVWGAVRVLGKRERDPLRVMAALVFVGAMASACLTPPWITEGAQLQSTTLVFFALLAFTGKKEVATTDAEASTAPARAGMGHEIEPWAAPLFLVAWLAAAFVFCTGRTNDVPSCADGAWVSHEPSMLVTVRDSGARGYSLERLERNLRFVGKHNGELTRPLVRAARPGLGIEMVLDACSGRAAVLLDEAPRLEAQPRGWMKIPGTTVDPARRIFAPAFP